MTVVALAVCVWFALGVRQAHDLNQATAIVEGGPLTRAQATQAASLLDDAGRLNPDHEVELARAQLLSDEGYPSRAIAAAQRVVRAEPANAVAWYELAQLAGSSNSHLVVAALRHIRQLIPPVGHAP